jgi:hypothetical protein
VALPGAVKAELFGRPSAALDCVAPAINERVAGKLRSLLLAQHPSQLCPNNWVPPRPAESRTVPWPQVSGRVTRTDWDRARQGAMERESVDLPRNAQVVGSSPTSGSKVPGYSLSSRPQAWCTDLAPVSS